MKRATLSFSVVALIVAAVLSMVSSGCDSAESQERRDNAIVGQQQSHYAKVQALPFYDYSIPRAIVLQIYDVVTQEARSTYTIIETIMGQTKHHGPSIGYGIPADVSLTNPLQPVGNSLHAIVGIEQAEPNGLFSSKNTDGTWVLFVDINGDVTPIYTEHKVTTFPYAVRQLDDGSWVRSDQERASLTVEIKR